MASVLAHNTIQPQVLAAVSQLSSLVSGLRSVSTSTSGRQHRHREAASGADAERSTQDQQKRSTAEELLFSTQLPELLLTEGGVDSLSKSLTVPDLCATLAALKTKENDASPWRRSHVSAQSFFENKTGYSRTPVPQSPETSAVLQLLRNTKVQRLLQRTFTSWATQQRRGFKTLRSDRIGGIGKDKGESFVDDLKSSLSSKLFKQKPQAKHTGEFNRMVNAYGSEPEVQDKLKVAFAEGYHAKEKTETDSKNSFSSRAFRFVFYLCLIWLGIQVIQVFTAVGGGPVRGLGVLGREHFEINPEEIHVNFSDVKGVEEAKQELKDIVDFLRDPEKFTALGAKLPKGCLLVGPPGIGKTLLARAVAGEAGVPFFHASGSEFDEVFVGTGAKRVRQLFSAAKQRSPCVIFIDEIDSVGAKRTSSQIHPYANQTINQLLSEMDGFSQNEGVIVLGATNRRDNLDQALLRPGRFDVEVRVFPPDLKGRKEIIEHYVTKIKKDPDVDPEQIARGTTGFTGADLENMVNQAALKAAIDQCSTVTMEHFDFARDKVLMGPAKKSKIMDEETNKLTAYHEAGHTLVAFFTKDAIPLHKVTIIPRGMSLGHTSFIHEKEVYGKNISQLKAEMDVAMGGRAAEEVIFGQEKVTTGASSDFQSATRIATAMVKSFGMSEKVGMRTFDNGDGVDSGLSMVRVNEVSPAIQEQVDMEIKRLLQESYDRARTILRSHTAEHKALATALLQYETLDKEDIAAIIEGRMIKKEL
ncbi:ATP-dependent zinc metalloprotease YME1L-like [Littorina saxatilis]|uniref:AAA+ ATPase domain-containing protein n=1 Tax=Littorina saxatilis TaxID=31220 RepID=A0AAN9G1U3_9CAEN